MLPPTVSVLWDNHWLLHSSDRHNDFGKQCFSLLVNRCGSAQRSFWRTWRSGGSRPSCSTASARSSGNMQKTTFRSTSSTARTKSTRTGYSRSLGNISNIMLTFVCICVKCIRIKLPYLGIWSSKAMKTDVEGLFEQIETCSFVFTYLMVSMVAFFFNDPN